MGYYKKLVQGRVEVGSEAGTEGDGDMLSGVWAQMAALREKGGIDSYLCMVEGQHVMMCVLDLFHVCAVSFEMMVVHVLSGRI